MAKYQREFLIPYIQDMTALHLALHKLENHLLQLEHQKSTLEKGIHRCVPPAKPCYEMANGSFLIVLSVFTLASSLWLLWMQITLPGLIGCICCLMEVSVGLLRHIQVSSDNSRKDRRYNDQLMEYRKLLGKNRQERDAIPGLEAEITRCQAEIENVKEALQKTHAPGIIPEAFRNVSAAIFLHSWFHTGNCNDLDTALNTYALVKSNIDLEQMIRNEGEPILKAYLDPAQPPERDASTMQEQLAQLPENERGTYLAMLQSTAAAAYFATASILPKL